MMWGTGYGSGGWAMMIGMIVVAVIVIAGLVVGAGWLSRTQRTGSIAGSSSSAEAILEARFARGEITKAELIHRRQVLSQKSTGTGA